MWLLLACLGFCFGVETVTLEETVEFPRRPVQSPLSCPLDSSPITFLDLLYTNETRTAPLWSELPPNFLIQSISFKIFGTPGEETQFTLLIGGARVSGGIWKDPSNGRNDPGCHSLKTCQSENADLYNTINWSYAGNPNNVTLVVNSGLLFISNMTLEITGFLVLPGVKSVTPYLLAQNVTNKITLELTEPMDTLRFNYFCYFSFDDTFEQTVPAQAVPAWPGMKAFCSVPLPFVQEEGKIWLQFRPETKTDIKFLLVPWEANVVPQPIVQSIHPLFGSPYGDDIVSLVGKYFTRNTKIAFGSSEREVKSTFVNSSFMFCLSHKMGDSLTAIIMISVNGLSYVKTPYEFVYNPVLTPLYPPPKTEPEPQPLPEPEPQPQPEPEPEPQPAPQPPPIVEPTPTPTPQPITPTPKPSPTPLPTPIEPPTTNNGTGDGDWIADWIKNNVVIVVTGAFGLLVILIAGAYLIRRRMKSSSGGGDDKRADIDTAEIIMGEKIGRGSFADVYKARWRHTDVAVKKLADTHLEQVVQDFLNESNLMLALRHPNIVTFMGTCVTSNALCIVTEYLDHGTLYSVLHNAENKLDDEDIRRFAVDCCKGMAYLHGSFVIHRDLKSKNLLIDRHWNLKVSDFGLSKLVGDNVAHTFTACGTPQWTAPEVLRNDPYSFEADVYSFGIILYEMCTLLEPYKDKPSGFNIVLLVAMEGLRPTIPEHLKDKIQPVFQKIMQQCYLEQPSDRPSFGALSENFESQFYAVSDHHVHHKKICSGSGFREKEKRSTNEDVSC